MTAISIEGMNIFRYLFYLGVINIIFRLIWKILPIIFAVALPVTTLSLSPRVFEIANKLLKAFGYYILVSLVVLLTLSAIEHNRTTGSFILYPIVGAFAIYIKSVNDFHRTRRRLFMIYGYDEIESLVFDAFFTIWAELFFIIALFVPVIAVNPLIKWAFGIVDWIYNIKVIGWLIAVGGVVYMLYIVWHGIAITELLIASLSRKIGRKGHPNRFQIMGPEMEEQNGALEVLESRPGKYIANESSDVFHLRSCSWARKIAKRNRIYFRTFQEALYSDKRPCKVCMPYKLWPTKF